ncbi:hypothetical protein SEA_VINCENZO_60 [Mycobacterium phage Vincenzo]|uniref:Uncharacterized protein n=2 Tax=Coopervirus vincenzo TaxID=1983110 RepID=A0A0F6SJJ4_9CAUD|nr:hypothetical protein SEA_VINCENZO_60 [Mycobacterium phage Vincenzo]AKF14322.1 hypothetical protein SEA_VINCENZO_60 [Mycobacterium phage Vincenzo]AKF14726.1 hypothetical protein SEA_ALANGRANT_61 [Mycobacterium phage AlanGrant]
MSKATAPATVPSTWRVVAAGKLNAMDHIGLTIRFSTYDDYRQITTMVDAELCQISSKSDQVFLTYGYGAEREVTLDVMHPVSVNPPADYSDYPHLVDPIIDK